MVPNHRELTDLVEGQKKIIDQDRKALDSELKELNQRELIWNGLVEAFGNNNSASIVKIFRDHADYFKQFRKDNNEKVTILEFLYEDSLLKTKETIRRFVSIFPKSCLEAGIKLDSNSRHPNYSINEFIRIEIDERNLIAKVQPRDGVAIFIPLDIQELITCIQTEFNRLFNSNRNQKHLLSGILKAYKAVCKEEKKEIGVEIPLRRVIRRFSKNRKQLKYDELNIDFGNILNTGKISVDGYRLTFNHTRDQRQGMLIFGFEKGGYMGFISFKKETK